jgi:hypothetical protein
VLTGPGVIRVALGDLVCPSGTAELQLGSAVTREIQLRGIAVGSRAMCEDMMRAIALHGLKPTLQVSKHSFEGAAEGIGSLTEGGHYGKICMRGWSAGAQGESIRRVSRPARSPRSVKLNNERSCCTATLNKFVTRDRAAFRRRNIGAVTRIMRQRSEGSSLASEWMKLEATAASWFRRIGAPEWAGNFNRGRGVLVRRLMLAGMLFGAFGLEWNRGADSHYPSASTQEEPRPQGTMIDALIDRIIQAESSGDHNRKNRRSSATGLAQFLDETWLEMIRAHRPDLGNGRSRDEVLQLRSDSQIVREITARYAERNARMLERRGMPVTPGTLYLAHFAGPAGAVAILSALDDADAALVLAGADASGRTKRDKLVKANPFLATFTVADLRSWADRKMRLPDL